MSHETKCPCGREAVAGTHGPRLCAGCDADHDAVLDVLLRDDFATAETTSSRPPDGTSRVVEFEFAMVDPAKGDLDGETFTLRDTDGLRAGYRATERVAMLSKRLGVRLVKTTATRQVRATGVRR